MIFLAYDATRADVIARVSLRPEPTTLKRGEVVTLEGDVDARILAAAPDLTALIASSANRFYTPVGFMPVDAPDKGGMVIAGYSASQGRAFGFDGRWWTATVRTDTLPPYSEHLPGTGDRFIPAKISAEMPSKQALTGPWQPLTPSWDKHAPSDLVLVTANPPQGWLDSDAFYAEDDRE